MRRKNNNKTMPTCTPDDLTGMWPSSDSVSSGFHSPGSPSSLSPISTSPDNTLKRRVIRRSEPFVIQSDRRDSRSQSPLSDDPPAPTSPPSLWVDLIGWYPLLLLRIAKAIVVAVLPAASWSQLLLAVPTFWLSLWTWFFWQLLQLPLNAFKFLMYLLLTSPSERVRRKRTILISGGSTIQALHLARNFYSAGARVIVVEVDGQFALARFSTAVSRFYTVPRPTAEGHQQYVRALCDIVHRENAVYYVPVSATTPAYFDAVAKPHLELLGCTCFVPGIKEVRALDDVLEVFKRCQRAGLPTPLYRTLTSREQVGQLYDTGVIGADRRCVMTMAGACGIRDRSASLVLPPFKHQLRLPAQLDVSEQRPWVFVEDVVGEHYVTCTTVKESRVVANVTCLLDVDKHHHHHQQQQQLIPVEQKDVLVWLEQFVGQLQLLRPITGHISFQLVQCRETGAIKPLSARVGVGLPYICYTNVHPRLLWKPCRHFRRQSSGPLVAENGRTVFDTLKHPSVEAVTKLMGTVLDKREALFAIWDPLPYCAYYHMQLPVRNFLGLVRRAQGTFPTPMAVGIQ